MCSVAGFFSFYLSPNGLLQKKQLWSLQNLNMVREGASKSFGAPHKALGALDYLNQYVYINCKSDGFSTFDLCSVIQFVICYARYLLLSNLL